MTAATVEWRKIKENTTRVVWIDYTNYRGERSTRRILPKVNGLRFGSNEWHPEDQWLLLALDVEKAEDREFAVKDIHSWRVIEPAEPSVRVDLQARRLGLYCDVCGGPCLRRPRHTKDPRRK